MTSQDYRAARVERGSQQKVAAMLGVSYHTVQRRESGESPINTEAVRALLSLPVKGKKK